MIISEANATKLEGYRDFKMFKKIHQKLFQIKIKEKRKGENSPDLQYSIKLLHNTLLHFIQYG